MTIKEITFQNDHTMYEEAGPCDSSGKCWGSGSALTGVDWASVNNPDHPVSYTRGTSMRLVVRMEVTGGASGTATLRVTGPDGITGLGTFNAPCQSTEERFVTIVKGTLPNVVKAYTPAGLSWSVQCPGDTIYRSAGSTSHRLYVTLGTPSGSNPTNRRMNFVCSAAWQAGTPLEAIDGVATVEARVTVTVMEVDLDIDTDRGGAITPGDDPGESTWSWGPSGAGAVVAPNVDDDDWAVGHTVLVDIDGTTPVLDTASDEGDLAQVIVRQADLPPDWHVWLTLVGDEKISVFDLDSGTAVLGHHAAGELLYQIPVGSVVAGDLEFGVEARGFVRGESLVPTTKLVLTVYDEFFQEVCSDEVQLRVSPWLMLSNLDPADTVYVRKLPGESMSHCQLQV